jgi:hypothetical protein
MIRDENGKVSTTRLILMLTFIIFAIASLTDVFGVVEINSQIYNIIQTIFGLALGGQAVRTSIKNYKAGESSGKKSKSVGV